MPRYPDFFQQHSVLPPGVAEPTDRTPWEAALLANAGAATASWVAVDPEGDEDAVWLPVTASGDTEGDDTANPSPGNVIVVDDLELTDADGRGQQASGVPPGTRPPGGADTIASYRPWHFWGADWGIYFEGDALFAHARRLAREIAQQGHAAQFSAVLRDAFEQVLAHEYTHFAGEILGTTLEATFQRSGYRDYLLTRYTFRNSWTTGACEEVIATHREVNAAQPGAFKEAAKTLATNSPPGYSEWTVAADKRERALLEAATGVQMLSAAGAGIVWPEPGAVERRAVPLYWRLGTSGLPPFLRRRHLDVSPRAVKGYLRKHRFTLDPKHTRGHHFWWTRGTVIAAYSVQRGEIPRKEHTPLAQNLGFATVGAFRNALFDGTVPPALLAASS